MFKSKPKPKRKPDEPAKARRVEIETITALRVGEHYIRVWRGADQQGGADNTDIAVKAQGQAWHSQIVLALALAELDRVSAVEVKDAQGNGLVIYNDWP